MSITSALSKLLTKMGGTPSSGDTTDELLGKIGDVYSGGGGLVIDVNETYENLPEKIAEAFLSGKGISVILFEIEEQLAVGKVISVNMIGNTATTMFVAIGSETPQEFIVYDDHIAHS